MLFSHLNPEVLSRKDGIQAPILDYGLFLQKSVTCASHKWKIKSELEVKIQLDRAYTSQ